jgi:hypothetical protein
MEEDESTSDISTNVIEDPTLLMTLEWNRCFDHLNTLLKNKQLDFRIITLNILFNKIKGNSN